MWIQDRHSHGILEANQAALARLGLCQEDVRERCWTDLVEGSAALLPRPEGKIRHLGKDGRSLDLHLIAHDVNCDPPVVLVVVIAKEFPSGPGKESALLEETDPGISVHRYQKLFERSLAGMFKTTPGGAFLDCNEALAQMLGCDTIQGFLLGKPMPAEACEALLERCFSGNH